MNRDLFDKLEQYALKYTNTTREELVDMWNEAARAAEKYGSVTNAKEVFSNSDSSTAVQSILQQMKQNGSYWTTAKTDAERTKYANANLELGKQLEELLGKPVRRDGNGVWWVGDQKLFTYHSGTPSVGQAPTLKQTEVWAKLEKGESVYTKKQQDVLHKMLNFNLLDRFDKYITQPIQKVRQYLSGEGGASQNIVINVQTPLTMYGNMTDETMRILDDHKRKIADMVAKQLKS